MKTVFNPILKRRMFRMSGMVLSVLLALSMMAAALPQPALAATPTATCASTYTVKTGDSKSSIADAFGLKWTDIAQANNMATGAKPKVGQKLCIPTKAWLASAYAGKMTASAVGKKLSVTMSDFGTRSIWNVRVKDASSAASDYFMLGRITAPAKGSVTKIFNLPQDLQKTPTLTVCVTNAASSKVICTKIKHVVQ